MNISHHPGEDLLFDYASGSLSESWSVAIATHLALCPECRRVTSDFEIIGGGMISSAKPSSVSDNLFDSVMAVVDGVGEEAEESEEGLLIKGADEGRQQFILPQPLRKYVGCDVGEVAWNRLGLNAHQLKIPLSDESASIRLLKIPAGRPVPTHSHHGRELTLVLSGAFSDVTGTYGRGDMQDLDDSVEHQPHAAPGEDCICLVITDHPLKFKSRAARMIQPLLGI